MEGLRPSCDLNTAIRNPDLFGDKTPFENERPSPWVQMYQPAQPIRSQSLEMQQTGLFPFPMRVRDGARTSNPSSGIQSTFQCSFLDCTYHELGFVSQAHLQNHTLGLHKSVIRKPASGMPDPSNDDEVKLVLEDPVVVDDLDMIRDMKGSVRVHATTLIHVCTKRDSSIPMLKLIVEPTEGVKSHASRPSLH